MQRGSWQLQNLNDMVPGLPCTGFLIPGGRPDLLTLLPIGFGLMFLANLVLQRDLQRRCASPAERPVGLHRFCAMSASVLW